MARKKRIRLGILFGGRSAEHEVSLKSAVSVISALDTEIFDITAVGITPNGRFADADEVRKMLPEHLIERVRLPDAPESSLRQRFTLPAGKDRLFDPGDSFPEIFFPLLHGPYGEDGTIQGFLETADVPYIGCGVIASSVSMDKDFMKRLFMQAGLPVAPYRTVHSRNFFRNPETLKRSVSKELGYPMFCKPANMGSSIGVCKIHSEEEFIPSLKHSAQFDAKILVEKGLDARELECAILGNEAPEASVVGEIIPAHEFYDYDAKYISPDSRLEIPARIPGATSNKIRDLALRSFKAVEGSGLARIDFFLERRTQKVWINEINTMPGFTPISMYAKLWASSGIPFQQLVEKLVLLGKERFLERSNRKISTV
ncbi:MAG: D-alanine--D-alanine ligase [Acidobacteria bacterium]|nr:D-alanine--D-alanine ligase [Acidobacteriota bacterium]